MEIVKYPDSLLKESSLEVENLGSQELQNTIEEMKETMILNNGIGLAAVQVGLKQRLFLAKEDEEILIFINPVIKSFSQEKNFHEEGCLSIPMVYADVLRPVEIEIEFVDLEGKPYKKQFGNFTSRIIQHEMDHLDGVLFFDRISRIKRKILLKQYKELQIKK